MYVDDSQGLTIATEAAAKHMVASSHEAAYILRGFPGPLASPIFPATVADDKQDKIIRPCKMLLGKVIDSDNLFVQLPREKLERFWQTLRANWNRSRKQFTLRDAAQLQGNLLYCVWLNGWLQPMSIQITGALRLTLAKNAERLRYDTRFEALWQEATEDWMEPTAVSQPSRVLGLRHEYTRALWRCEVQTHIPKEIHTQCEILARIVKQSLDHPDQHPWRRHIGPYPLSQPSRARVSRLDHKQQQR